jgi:hypothetical protein
VDWEPVPGPIFKRLIDFKLLPELLPFIEDFLLLLRNGRVLTEFI